MTTETAHGPSTQKVRRRVGGNKGAPGHRLQRDGRRVRRPDPGTVRVGRPDPTITAVGGLARFGAYTRQLGLQRALHRRFSRLKTGKGVVYPMATQLGMLIDVAVVGAKRVFDLERLALDPLFTHLAGGAVSSVDTMYRDLQRFDAAALEDLERLVTEHGTAPLREQKFDEVYLDVDSTVTPLFGQQEEAFPGPNPRYHGRPSHHPLLAFCANTRTVVGARLRPGDTGFGVNDIEDIETWIDRTRDAIGADALMMVRIDAAGDCADILASIARKGSFFLVKMKQTGKLLWAVAMTKKWKTIDSDAFGRPTRQVAEIEFARPDWPTDTPYRVFAVRTTERLSGRQTCLWDGLDDSVSIYVTNDHHRDADDLARLYDKRGACESIIDELKNSLGFGKAPSHDFEANEAAMLVKVLAFNLLRRWVVSTMPVQFHLWRTKWIRDLAISVPGRLLRSQGRWELRMQPRPMLN
jgi:hypothetical protein